MRPPGRTTKFTKQPGEGNSRVKAARGFWRFSVVLALAFGGFNAALRASPVTQILTEVLPGPGDLCGGPPPLVFMGGNITVQGGRTTISGQPATIDNGVPLPNVALVAGPDLFRLPSTARDLCGPPPTSNLADQGSTLVLLGASAGFLAWLRRRICRRGL